MTFAPRAPCAPGSCLPGSDRGACPGAAVGEYRLEIGSYSLVERHRIAVLIGSPALGENPIRRGPIRAV